MRRKNNGRNWQVNQLNIPWHVIIILRRTWESDAIFNRNWTVVMMINIYAPQAGILITRFYDVEQASDVISVMFRVNSWHDQTVELLQILLVRTIHPLRVAICNILVRSDKLGYLEINVTKLVFDILKSIFGFKCCQKYLRQLIINEDHLVTNLTIEWSGNSLLESIWSWITI